MPSSSCTERSWISRSRRRPTSSSGARRASSSSERTIDAMRMSLVGPGDLLLPVGRSVSATSGPAASSTSGMIGPSLSAFGTPVASVLDTALSSSSAPTMLHGRPAGGATAGRLRRPRSRVRRRVATRAAGDPRRRRRGGRARRGSGTAPGRGPAGRPSTRRCSPVVTSPYTASAICAGVHEREAGLARRTASRRRSGCSCRSCPGSRCSR